MGRKLLMCAALCLLLSGCAAGEARESSPAETGTAPPEQTQPQSVETVRSLTEDEIVDAYYRAVQVYEWFDISPLPGEGERIAVDGHFGRRVNYPGVESLGDLRAFLRGSFSDEVIQRLLEQDPPMYLESDGVLYVCGDGRERDRTKGTVSAQVEQLDQETYSVNVTVDLLAEDQLTVVGAEYASFPYQLVEDRWVFTDFWLLE